MGSDPLRNIAPLVFGFSGPLVRVHSLSASPQEVRGARSVVCMNQERERGRRRWIWGQYLIRLYNMIKKTGDSHPSCVMWHDTGADLVGGISPGQLALKIPLT